MTILVLTRSKFDICNITDWLIVIELDDIPMNEIDIFFDLSDFRSQLIYIEVWHTILILFHPLSFISNI